MSGTFNITKPTVLVNLVGGRGNAELTIPGWSDGVNGSWDSALLNGATFYGDSCIILANAGIQTNAIEFGFNLSTPIFELDGNPAISFNSLPSGFTITSASLTLRGVSNLSGTLTLRYGLLTPVVEAINNSTSGFAGYNIVPTGSMSSVYFISNRISLSASLDSTWPIPEDLLIAGLQVDAFQITGTYEIQQYQFALENPNTPIRVGDKVKITSTIPDAIKQIQVDYTEDNLPKTIIIDPDSDCVIIWEPYIIWFYLPLELGNFKDLIYITLIGDGVQFSGSVLLGILQILFEDASGIYALVGDQTDDELYFRDGYITDVSLIMLDLSDDDFDDFFEILGYPYSMLLEDYEETDDFTIISALGIPVTLLNVEIPSPFAKTAFLP